jgi:hypothetical protein
MSALEIEAKPAWRWQRELRGPDTLAEDLGMIGETVGPRTGPNKRTQGQKEDYVFRRFIAACKLAGRLQFPVSAKAEHEREGEPAFVLRWNDGHALGLEVTEAGSREYQAWLTATEASSRESLVADGVTEISSRQAIDDFADAISKKNARFDRGSYRVPDQCDLVVYDNTQSGEFVAKRELVAGVQDRNDLRGRFAAVHIVFGSHVALDVFGETTLVDVSRAYEADYAAWVTDQVARLRNGDTQLDRAYLAEELEDLSRSLARALSSHLRVLILHLLKLAYQPQRRSKGWIYSVDNARAEIQDLLTENPSLKHELKERIGRAYPQAKRSAAREMKAAAKELPATCPFTPEQLLDDHYLPGGSEDRDD